MKKKKKVGIIENLFFPGVLRVKKHLVWTYLPCMSPDPFGPQRNLESFAMRSLMIGWVQNEIHVCYHFQSLS